MKYVIKDNKVFATHENYQTIENLYPDCVVVILDKVYELDYEFSGEELIEISNAKIKAKYKKVMDEYVYAYVKRTLFNTPEYQSVLNDMYAELEALNG